MTKYKGAGAAILNVVLYFVGAAILFGWLLIRASNGGFLTAASHHYSMLAPSAPMIEPNKTDVITTGGVEVGVVTGVDSKENGALIEFKITGDVVFQEDAVGYVVIQHIIGQKAVMIDAGHAKKEASDGMLIPYADEGSIVNADDAMGPVREMIEIPYGEDFRDFVDRNVDVGEIVRDDAEEILEGVDDLRGVLSSQQEALERSADRSGALIDELSARGADISLLIERAADLATEVESLLQGRVDIVARGISLAADTLQLVSARQVEMSAILARLPYVAKLAAEVSDEVIRLAENHQGSYIDLSAVQVPFLDEILRILKET